MIIKSASIFPMTKNLTEGKPLSLILSFSIPVLLGYLFQQFYNVTDTVIVGKCLGVGALAAVGSTGAVNFLIIGFANGLCAGFAIPVAQRFGANDYPRMRVFIANIVFLGTFFSVILAVVTVLFCRPLLLLMQTPADIVDEAGRYISIIFAGIPMIFLYNSVSGIIRALGDSKTPVYFLVLSTVINIFLDLLFIIVFHTGVAGAAWATVIAQGLSGFACLLYMHRHFEIIRLKKSNLKLEGKACSALCGVGIPMGLQYSITAIGSVILQTSVNMLGSSAVASVTAAGKVNMFFCVVYDALGTTMATYGGQNTGACKFNRLSAGVRDSMIISSVYAVLVFSLYLFAGQYFIMLFVHAGEAKILHDAKMFLLENSSCYILLAAVNIFRFMIQGMGFSRLAIVSGVMEMLARILIAVFLVPRIGLLGAGLASPFAWLLADVFLVPAFICCAKKLSRSIACCN